jgi:hypothetical protein
MTNITYVLENGQFEQGCSTGPSLLGYWSFNSSLIDWWPANSNANDAVGTNNGTLNNVTFTNGISGDGFYFSGSASYISFGTNAGNFGTNDFTIDFWIQTTATSEEAILEKRPVCNWGNMWSLRMQSGGTLKFEIAQDSIGEPDCYDTTLYSLGTVNNGGFHEVTIARTGLVLTVSIDGNLDNSINAVALANINNTTTMTAGNNPCVGHDGTQYFKGVLDEIKLAINGTNLNPWLGNFGQEPLTDYALQNPFSPWGNALLVESNTAANLSYPYIATNGAANINCINGAVSFWLKPDWNGGTGPGANPGQILEIGDTNSLDGWWSLGVDPTGSNLSFQSKSNGVLTTYFTQSIASWSSNDWYQLVLDYSTNQTSLFTNGVLAQTGQGMTNYPDINSRLAYGFSIGSNHDGTNQARASFDELATFYCPLNPQEVIDGYLAELTAANGLFISNVIGFQVYITQPMNNTIVP